MAAALRAGAAAIDPADEIDPSAFDLVFNAHSASALDQVAGDHGGKPRKAYQARRRPKPGDASFAWSELNFVDRFVIVALDRRRSIRLICGRWRRSHNDPLAPL